ncbi:hypothetical protein ACKVEX_00230 [Rhodocyclaceae bacterium SMB388]
MKVTWFLQVLGVEFSPAMAGSDWNVSQEQMPGAQNLIKNDEIP